MQTRCHIDAGAVALDLPVDDEGVGAWATGGQAGGDAKLLP